MLSWPVDLLPPSIDPDDVRRTAEEILSRPEYAEPQQSIVDRIIDAVSEFFGDVVAGIAGGGPGGLVSLLVVGALLAGAGWLVWRAAGAGWGRATIEASATTMATAADIDPDTWFAEADAREAEGDRRGALRCRYQGMVATLVRRGVVDDVAGRTPHELSLLLAPRLDHLTSVFEAVWYGGDDVDGPELASFTDEVSARLDELKDPATMAVPA